MICGNDNSNNTLATLLEPSTIYAQITYWLKINGNAQAGAKMYARGLKFLLNKGFAKGYCLHNAKLFYLKRPDEMTSDEMKSLFEILSELFKVNWMVVSKRSGFQGICGGIKMCLLKYMHLVDLYSSTECMIQIHSGEFAKMLAGKKNWKDLYKENDIDLEELKRSEKINVMRVAVYSQTKKQLLREKRKNKLKKRVEEEETNDNDAQ